MTETTPDPLRLMALDQALRFWVDDRGHPTSGDVVEAAEAFYAFLTADSRKLVEQAEAYQDALDAYTEKYGRPPTETIGCLLRRGYWG